ncbi:hypothetical protein F4703DRAFT_1730482 [Phycomyces blakesleeanus]
MAPIVLKIKGNESFSPFSNLHSGDDLSKTWRVCTKVKDSLENGSRLENLSWRLWFLHNVLVGDPKAKSNFKRISSNATHKLESEKVTENFVLHQYTSDQARDQVVELENIFGSFGDMQAFMNPIPGEMPMVEMDLDTMMDEPSWQQYSQPNYTPQVPLYSLNSYSHGDGSSAYYVTYSDSMPPLPTGTLRNKLLASLPRKTLASAERLLSPAAQSAKNIKSGKRGIPSEGKPPICSNCDTTSTPLWRRSVQDELLCNACGLYLKLHNAPRPKHLKPHSIRKDSRGEEDLIQPVCSNCKTNTTPLWRRDIEGQSLCNACGLYLKLHHEKRPLSMKTDIIKKRQRCENQNQQTGKKPSKKGRSESQEQDEEITLEITTSVWQNNTIQQYSNPYIYSSNNKDKAPYRQKNNGRDELVISR